MNHNFLTLHGQQRAKERKGMNGKAAERATCLALLRGKTAQDFTLSERTYLESQSSTLCIAIAYDGFCFIINKETRKCVTLFPLPKWFHLKKHPITNKAYRDKKIIQKNQATACFY